MKTSSTGATLGLAALLFVPGVARASAIPDLSFSQALYVSSDPTHFKTTDPHATPRQPLTITPANGTACDAKGCTFQLGFFAYRQPKGQRLETDVMLSVEGGVRIDKPVSFAPQDDIENSVVPVRLPFGTSLVTITVDPYQRVAETDESNNSFDVQVRVTTLEAAQATGLPVRSTDRPASPAPSP